MGINIDLIKAKLPVGKTVEVKHNVGYQNVTKSYGKIVKLYKHFVLIDYGTHKESILYTDIAIGHVVAKVLKAA